MKSILNILFYLPPAAHFPQSSVSSMSVDSLDKQIYNDQLKSSKSPYESGSHTDTELQHMSQSSSLQGNTSTFIASSSSIGDISMGSDSVFVSETEMDIDKSNLRSNYDICPVNILLSSNQYNIKNKCSQICKLDSSNDIVEISLDGSENYFKPVTSTNYAQTLMNNYVSSHRNSISEVIEALNTMAKADIASEIEASVQNQKKIMLDSLEIDSDKETVPKQNQEMEKLLDNTSDASSIASSLKTFTKNSKSDTEEKSQSLILDLDKPSNIALETDARATLKKKHSMDQNSDLSQQVENLGLYSVNDKAKELQSSSPTIVTENPALKKQYSKDTINVCNNVTKDNNARASNRKFLSESCQAEKKAICVTGSFISKASIKFGSSNTNAVLNNKSENKQSLKKELQIEEKAISKIPVLSQKISNLKRSGSLRVNSKITNKTDFIRSKSLGPLPLSASKVKKKTTTSLSSPDYNTTSKIPIARRSQSPSPVTTPILRRKGSPSGSNESSLLQSRLPVSLRSRESSPISSPPVSRKTAQNKLQKELSPKSTSSMLSSPLLSPTSTTKSSVGNKLEVTSKSTLSPLSPENLRKHNPKNFIERKMEKNVSNNIPSPKSSLTAPILDHQSLDNIQTRKCSSLPTTPRGTPKVKRRMISSIDKKISPSLFSKNGNELYDDKNFPFKFPEIIKNKPAIMQQSVSTSKYPEVFGQPVISQKSLQQSPKSSINNHSPTCNKISNFLNNVDNNDDSFVPKPYTNQFVSCVNDMALEFSKASRKPLDIGIKRADSLEEFLLLESECMGSRN